jgi:hypothetical protein
MGGQHGSGENSGLVHDFPAIKLASPSDGSAGRDTHIAAVDRGDNTIESDGGSSVDSEVSTHLAGD